MNLWNFETSFPHKLFLTNTQLSKVFKAFANGSSANIKFLTTQLSRLAQLGGFLFGAPDVFGPPITITEIETTS